MRGSYHRCRAPPRFPCRLPAGCRCLYHRPRAHATPRPVDGPLRAVRCRVAQACGAAVPGNSAPTPGLGVRARTRFQPSDGTDRRLGWLYPLRYSRGAATRACGAAGGEAAERVGRYLTFWPTCRLEMKKRVLVVLQCLSFSEKENGHVISSCFFIIWD